MLLLSIPTPCHENWDAMLPNEQGAFCHACAKTVVDFTGMSDDEVKQYFLQHQGQKTCGRFDTAQVAAPGIDLPTLFSSTLPYWKKFLAAVIIAFGSLFTSCTDTVAGNTRVTGDTVDVAMLPPAPVIDTAKPVTRLLGDTVAYPDSPKPACSPVMGKII
ncbi:MAG TPA: hypothetical protein VLD19_15235, partial [Chitinophagaceae bacterium]|nr:hypothetical protein [Chitinophagaceae bacterium]